MGLNSLRRKFAKPDSVAENVFDSFENDSSIVEQENVEYKFKEPKSDFVNELREISDVNENLYTQIKTLNTHQQQSIFDASDNCVLSAMVGSGKTTVIVYKILYLHLVKNVPFEKMMVLTFTNKAAKEIQIRLGEFLSDKFTSYKHEMRFFGTFHSVARQLIKEHSLLSTLGFTPGFSILDQNDSESIIKQITLENTLNIKYENKILKRVENYIKHKEILMGNMKLPDDLPQLIKLLRAYKQKYNLLDFNDLLSVLIFLLKKKNDSSFDWIIVDEFQDCNKQQIEILSLIKILSTKEFLVGDPNQSIYAWRGSSPVLIDKYIKNNESVMMNLPLNYRTSENILSACSFLLMDKSSIKASKHKGRPIVIKEHYDDMQEAYYMCAKFKQMLAQGISMNNIAILFRTKSQTSIFETIFKKENIEYNLVQKLELKDINVQFWFLKLISSGLDCSRLDSLLEVFSNKEFQALKLTKKIISQLHLSSNKTDTLREILKSKKNVSPKFVQLIDRIENFKDYLLLEKNIEQLNFIEYFGLADFINPTSLLYAENYEKLIFCQQEIIKYMIANNHADNFTMLAICVDAISLEGSFNINNSINNNSQGVSLMTIHASKGLEFEYIFLSGANDGLIPLERKNAGKDHLKEEKRLLFVALTRAKRNLEVSFHTQPKAWNAEQSLSYFFNLIPNDLLSFEEESKKETSTNKNIANNKPYNVNDKVKHSKYGCAIVLSCDENEIVCDFDNYGKKKFNTQMVSLLLTKIND